MDTFQPSLPASSPPRPAREPRTLPASAGASFWSEAWRIFCAAPLIWILILVIYVGISILLSMIPLIGSIAQLILTPVFSGGVMLGCHALARGEPLSVSHLFDGFKQGRFGPLVILGLILLAMGIVFAIVMFCLTFATLGMAGISSLARESDPTLAIGSLGIGFFVLLAVGLTLAFLIGMAYWFAPALVVLDAVEPITALKKSFVGCWINMLAFLIYGLIYIGLAIVASIPFALGWLVLGPMIAGSCFAGWRQIYSA